MNVGEITKKWFPVIIAVIIVGSGLGIPYGLGFISFTHGTTTPSANLTIPAGQFYQISNEDFAPPGQVDIYLSSWYGCPIGAADSWFIYDYFSNFINMTPYVLAHDVNIQNGAIPGLLFKSNISFGDKSLHTTIDFYSYYLYNLYLNRTAAGFNDLTGGIPIPQNQLVSTGISELRTSSFPTPVVNTIINITTVDHIEGMNSPSAYLHPPNDKINTVMVITGVSGTWILNLYMIKPQSLNGISYQNMMENYGSYLSIENATGNFTKALEYSSGSVPCP